MKKLLPYLKGSRMQCVLAPLFKMFEAILELLVPLVIAEIIDKGIGSGDKDFIIRMCIVLILLGAVGLAFSITAQFFAAQASVAFVKRLKHALFKHIGKLSYSQLDSQGTSTLITRMTSDMDSVQNGLNLTLRLLLRSPFVVLGAMVMAFTVDAKAAITFVVLIPLLSVVVFGILFSCIPLYKKVRSRLDAVLGSARENLVGARVLRAFRKESVQISEFEARNEALTKMQEFTGKISALLNPVTFIIVNIGIAVLIYMGALRVEAGIITQGAVVALYNYMSQILVELVKFANLIISITKSVACADRISAVLETPADICEGNETEKEETDMSVEFENVSFTYEGAGEASLENISFSAKKGETVGIIGSTGSGKTTLINLIPAFYRADSGEIRIKGKSVCNWNETLLREKIAVVPQKSVLFKGTIKDNMLWGKSNATDNEIWSALETAQAKDFVQAKGGGLDAPVEQGGTNFSGGQRQRLCVARAVISDADILIFDDSSSALDYATDAAMRKAIAALQGEKTVFIVSQRTSSIMGADKIILLDDGKAEIGTHEELLKNSSVYREIHLSQFEEGEAAV